MWRLMHKIRAVLTHQFSEKRGNSIKIANVPTKFRFVEIDENYYKPNRIHNNTCFSLWSTIKFTIHLYTILTLVFFLYRDIFLIDTANKEQK